MKNRKIIILLILLTVVIISTLNISITSLITSSTATISRTNALQQSDCEYQGLIINADNLVANSTNAKIIANNTAYLQKHIDDASEAGGGMVKIPAGTYYFASVGVQRKGVSECVIKCKDNVIIEGAGTNERTGTILKPYAPSNYLPVDMFYYNNYAETEGNDTTYLKSADFRNFIVDGSDAVASTYTSAGKAFMINLLKDCDWDNVVVRNTDGTGIGVDCPINCTINNCIAINCGKGGYIHERNYDTEAPGASGIGIGTGFTNEESMYITNCTVENNYKYGIFFEHQGRFSDKYNANDAIGFIVSNCIAKGNRYDFGGERANDVTYENCLSQSDNANFSAIHFGNMSRNTHIINCKVERQFTDVADKSQFFYKPVYWALNNSITDGTSSTKFSPYENITRAQAVVFIWRMAERPGDVVLKNETIETGYDDVPSNVFYADAIKWAREEGIISESTNFLPTNGVTRAEFITMLWRYAGKPKVTSTNNFKDILDGAYYKDAVNWAISIGIANGKDKDIFSPNDICSRAEAVTFLYRFNNKNDTFNITYNLDGGKASNPQKYQVGNEITLKNPTKKGYTFIGWTGSNYSEYVESGYTPKTTAKIIKSDTGNKTFTANWEPNEYTVTFNSNGGKGTMDKQYFIYDDVSQTLLENEFIRENYKFKAWNTKSNGRGTTYNDEQAVKNLISTSNGNVTLYAQWEIVTSSSENVENSESIDNVENSEDTENTENSEDSNNSFMTQLLQRLKRMNWNLFQ